MANTIPDLNIALAEALGISDTKHLSRVTLVLAPNAYPLVTVEKHLRDADGIRAVAASWRLKPTLVPTFIDVTSIASTTQEIA